MSLTYITSSGVVEQIQTPLRPSHLDEILPRTCDVVNQETRTVWVSGDIQAMRSAEKVAAAVGLNRTYGVCVTAEKLLEDAANLLVLLKLTPSWRDR